MLHEFIKSIIDLGTVYVDELDQQDFYTDLINHLGDNDLPILEQYIGINDSFDLALEKSGRVLEDDDDLKFSNYGC